jgi:hypothetical protein
MGEQSTLADVSKAKLEPIRELSTAGIAIHLFVKKPTLICWASAAVTLKASENIW